MAVLLSLCLWVLQLKGQTLYSAGEEEIWIGKEAVISVQGDVVNHGIMTNNGLLYVSGNWQNEGVYTPAKGKMILQGNRQQLIHHGGQPVASLQVTGTGEKVLQSALKVRDSLILQEGVIVTSAEGSLLLGSEASIEGGSVQSFIEGPLHWEGIGYRYFPVGVHGNFYPLELVDVQGNHPVLSVTVREPLEAGEPGEKLVLLMQQRYWEVIPLEGVYQGSQVSLAVAGDEGFSDLAGVVVAAAAESGGVYMNIGQSEHTGNEMGGSVYSQQKTALSYLTLGITTEFALKDQILVPSAFAPNAADPRNRVLKVFATNVLPQDFVFKVFNRWGVLVYETSSLEEAAHRGWDGFDANTRQQAAFGVYTYYLRARLDNQMPVEQTGTITIFR